MNTCEMHKLSAFLDGELDAAEQQRLAAHLANCEQCQAELESLRSLSSAFGAIKFDELKPIERARLHDHLDEQMDAPIWRIGGAMGLIAASILVIAGTWLAAIPSPQHSPLNTTGGNTVIATAPDDWQNMALTGFVPVGTVDQHVYMADAHLDEWMVNALNGSQP